MNLTINCLIAPFNLARFYFLFSQIARVKREFLSQFQWKILLTHGFHIYLLNSEKVSLSIPTLMLIC